MKTNLPAEINTVEQAQEFLTELHKNGETFHPEDDAFDILWETTEVSEQEKTRLNKLMADIYALPGSFDPCGFLLDLMGHETIEEDNQPNQK